ncbi:MAG: histidine phosphatase family protein, partial [Candidatus Tectomicrobia bacterium]|nr:histidine phosphatase family protein [Candidatus Tectomicrobia bacterium]
HNLSCETIKNFKDLENGEPPEQFSARVSKAFRELLEKKVGKNELICIVSHEKPLNIMLKEFLGIQDKVPHFHLDFCSISRVALVNGECHVFSINETSHLTSAPHPSF